MTTPAKTKPPRRPVAAKPAAPTPPPTLGDHAPPADELPDTEREASDIIARLRSSGHDGAVVKISRRAIGETEFAHVGEVVLSDFSEAHVQNVYGGGTYKARVLTSAGTFAGQFRFAIDSRIPAKNPNQPPAAVATPSAVSELRAMFDGLRPLLERAANPPPAPPPAPAPDNTQLFLAFMKMSADAAAASRQQLVDLITALKPAGPSPEVEALRREIAELKSGRAGGGDTVDKTLRLMDAIDERAERRAPAADAPKTGLLGIVEAIGRGAATALAQHMPGMSATGLPMPGPMPPPAIQPAPPPDASGVTVPVYTPPPSDPSASNPPANSETMIPANYVSQFAARAIEAAGRDDDPGEFSGGILAAVPGVFHGRVFLAANAPTWFADLFPGTFAEQANAHREWIDDMRFAILDRWFLAYCREAVANKFSAEATLAEFVKSVSADYHPALAELKSPEEISGFFSGQRRIPETWVEEMRRAVEKLTQSDTPPQESEKARV